MLGAVLNSANIKLTYKLLAVFWDLCCLTKYNVFFKKSPEGRNEKKLLLKSQYSSITKKEKCVVYY